MPQTNVSDIAVELENHIDTFSPMDYMENIEEIPAAWIDHYDSTPRRILCISDGRQERQYVTNDPQSIDSDDVDDVLYYLDAALSEERLWGQEDTDDEMGKPCVKNPANVDGKPTTLKAGKEYTLDKAGIDYDSDLGLVWIEEIKNDYGFPAFLFEELAPVSSEKRMKSYKEWRSRLPGE